MQQEEAGMEITTPPQRLRSTVLTPPPTDKRPSLIVQRVLRAIKRHYK
jgi:hypothetical protein